MISVNQNIPGKKIKRKVIVPPQPTRYLKRRDGAILKAYNHSDLLRTGPIKIN